MSLALKCHFKLMYTDNLLHCEDAVKVTSDLAIFIE